jgi:hypothetical protein
LPNWIAAASLPGQIGIQSFAEVGNLHAVPGHHMEGMLLDSKHGVFSTSPVNIFRAISGSAINGLADPQCRVRLDRTKKSFRLQLLHATINDIAAVQFG